MRYDWRGEVPYLFPPVQMIPRVLQKVAMEQITAVMVLPEWPSRPWWNLMRGMAVAQGRLGKSEVALRPGPSLEQRLAKVPPGEFLMVHLSSQV
jgi:hypothetical protein